MDNYTSTNSELIAQLNLIKHPEGGYFAETDRQVPEVPSPFAGWQISDGSPKIFAQFLDREQS
jgi:predicted cupin superfamily sugar epimerase